MVKVKDIARGVYWRLPSKFIDYIQDRRSETKPKKLIYRPYFDETKSIYVHIPKVAGKSISIALYGEDPKHHLLSDFQQIDSKKYDSYFKFSFVRNPWSKLFSAYNYLMHQNKEYPFGKYHWMTRYGSFQDFCMRGLSEKLIENDLFFYKQVKYLKNLNDQIDADFIGKFENIEHDFDIICKRLEVGAKLQAIGRATVKESYKKAYTSKMIDKVGFLYYDDIKQFKYDFCSVE